MAIGTGSRGDHRQAAQADTAALTLQYSAIVITATAPTLLGVKHQIGVAGAGVMPDGFLMETGAENEVVHYDGEIGPQKAVAGAAVASPGVELVVGASGKLVPASSGTTGDVKCARSREPASGDGSVFEVFFGFYGLV